MSMTTIAHVPAAAKPESPPPLLPIPGRPLAYYPALVPYVGGIKAAILLCQLVYWTPRARNAEGWIYKTQTEIMRETGLTWREQRAARDALKQRGLLEEHYDRLEHQLYLRINVALYNATMDAVGDDDVPPLYPLPPTMPAATGKPNDHHRSESINSPPHTTANPLILNQVTKCHLGKLQKGISGNDKTSRRFSEITLSESTTEIKTNVNVANVESERAKPHKLTGLSEREEALAQEIARHLDGDGHSLGAIRRIVSADGLGEDIALRLMAETFELDEAQKIRTSPGAYFIDAAKREAQRQGIDLGFKPAKRRRRDRAADAPGGDDEWVSDLREGS